MKRGAIGTAVIVFIVLSAGSPALAADGALLFAQRCAGCHGQQGEGRGSFPPLAGSSRLSDSDALGALIRQGGGGMPAFASLPNSDLQALVLYVQETWGERPPSDTGSEGSPPRIQGDPRTGAALFEARCTSCHGDGGAGRGPYPALKDNPALGDATEVEAVIRQGRGGMPAYAELSPEDVADLVAFVQSIAGVAHGGDGEAVGEGGTGSPTTTVPVPVAQGDASRGKRLFMGGEGLAKGGGACVACHVAGSHGAVTGGALGTDLTAAVQRYGSEDAISNVLENPQFPIMRAAYADAPLNEQERADLAAFLATLDPAGGGQSILVDRFWVFGIIGAGALFGALALAASRRRPGLAQELRGSRRQGRGA